jgi:dihydroceramidase
VARFTSTWSTRSVRYNTRSAADTMVKVSPVHRIGQRTFGVWGAHTSTLDWCEVCFFQSVAATRAHPIFFPQDNYVFTNYVAEAYNSFSNVPFFFLGLHGFVHTMSLTSGPTRQPHPHRYRYALCHLGISAIGIGSFIFHATLLWHAQVLLDELPMIWVASLILWTTLAAGPDDQSAGDSIGLRLGFVTLPVLITAA